MKSYIAFLFLIIWPFCTYSQNENTEIKIEAKINKTAYVGETLTYEIILYSTSSNIENVRVIDSPQISENCKVINGSNRGSKAKHVEGKGKFKFSWVIQRDFIVPEEIGKLNISEGNFIVFVPRERIVNGGFWGRTRMIEYEEIRAKCNSIAVKVNKLPKTSDEFSGCVGDFKIDAWFPPGNIYKGQEAYVMFRISGYGSLQKLKIPSLHKLFAEGCHLREVEQNEELMQKNGKLFSEITLICKFIPEADTFKINSLCMVFLNNETGKYYNACSEVLNWDGSPREKKKSNSNKDAIAI